MNNRIFNRSKVDLAYDYVTGIYRNYPDWPSTFGLCKTEGCDKSARGSWLCADCCEKELTKLAGKYYAEEFHKAVKEQNIAYYRLMDAVELKNKEE